MIIAAAAAAAVAAVAAFVSPFVGAYLRTFSGHFYSENPRDG